MKNVQFSFGMILIVLVFGILVVGCPNGTTDTGKFDGTWKKGDVTIIINGDNCTLKFQGNNVTKGKIIYINETSFRLTSTHFFDYTPGVNDWVSDTSFDETGDYTVSGNIATIYNCSDSTFDGIWTK